MCPSHSRCQRFSRSARTAGAGQGAAASSIPVDGIPAHGIPADGIPAALGWGQALRERAGARTLGSMSSSYTAVTRALPKRCKYTRGKYLSQLANYITCPQPWLPAGQRLVLGALTGDVYCPGLPPMGPAGWVPALHSELHCRGNNHLAL